MPSSFSLIFRRPERRTTLTCREAFAKGFDPASGNSINSEISGESENHLTYTNQTLTTNSCFGLQFILRIRKPQTLSGKPARGEFSRSPPKRPRRSDTDRAKRSKAGPTRFELLKREG